MPFLNLKTNGQPEHVFVRNIATVNCKYVCFQQQQNSGNWPEVVKVLVTDLV